MRYRDCIIAWQPVDGFRSLRSEAPEGSIEVGPHPDRVGWSDRYSMTSGGCWLQSKKWTSMRAALQVMLDFNGIVVKGKLDPQVVHREFLKIDEYRFHIARDTPGAADWPDWYVDLTNTEKAFRQKADNNGPGVI